MPQTEAKFQVNQFTGGLNTDANPLADAGGTSRDEINCEILSHGGRRRRRGFAPEVGAVESSVVLTSAQKQAYAFSTHNWNDVANVGGLDFAVYQEGPTLYFYDKSDASLSLGRKSFSINLASFKTSAATTAELQNTRVSTASGKGVLFVCGSTIEPFYVEYNTSNDTITTTQVTIQIRDFEDLSDGIGVKDEVNITETAANGEHLYNLLNQGWYQTGLFLRNGGSTNRDGTAPAIELYRSVIGDFPRKNTPWYFGKYLVAEDSGQESNQFLSPQQVRSAPSGNTPSANGHYILDAFNKDRAQVVIDDGDDLRATFAYYARIDNLDPVTEDQRPNAVAFYAGRVWWALNNDIYFSQILDTDDVSAAGKCYQDGDPTSEGESDVVATDGGLIPVSGMGRATALAVTGTSLIVLADNGVWAISGAAGDSFTAVDFSVNRLSTLSCRSPESVVEAEGLVFFWGEYGVYIIQPGNLSENANLDDLVEGRITEFYKDIPQASKRNCSGFYDPVEKTIYWMYKSAADEAGISVNRYAYDRLLNFSLKFSAWFPWTSTVSANNQIIGGLTSGGVVTTFVEENVVDSGGAAVTTSGGEIVTVRISQTTEISEVPKFFCLTSGTSVNVAEAMSTTFTDWPDDDASDYTSYIETFYHIQDDPMAFMQAPYTYIYFRRTDETATAVTDGTATYAQVNSGGLTPSGTFISELYKSSPASGEDAPHLPANSALIIGEDGNRYQFEHGGNGTGDNEDTITLYNVDTGAAVWSRTNSQINADLVAAGVEPTSGYLTSQGEISCFTVPGTAYFIVILGQGSGVDTSKGVGYYRVPSSGTPELVGGLSGEMGDVSGSQADLLSPDDANASTIVGFGYINAFSTDLDSGDSRFAAQAFIPYQYPMCVAYEGETRPTVLTLPSINEIIKNGPFNDSAVEDWWFTHEEQLTTAMDANVLDLRGHPSGAGNRQRVFFLPDATAGSVFIPWKQLDIDQHIAGTEAVTSTFLQTHDSTYSSGFVSSVPLTITSGGSTSFVHTSTLGGTATVQANANWTGYPFTDETDDFDGTSGTATDNFTMAPSCFPLYNDDIDGPWLMFWPKVFRNQSQSDKIMLKVMLYDPTTGDAKLLDSDSSDIVDFSTNTTQTSGHDPEQVSVYWDRTDGTITVQVFYDNASTESIVTSTWGIFTPQISGVNFFAGGGLEVIESSCLLNTRWEWSNNNVSGKVSPDIQVYRGGRMRLVTDPTDPEPTGLPVYVSKTKTRGRGRVLQLRLRSETGKDFEIYGWAVWSAKNTRY